MGWIWVGFRPFCVQNWKSSIGLYTSTTISAKNRSAKYSITLVNHIVLIKHRVIVKLLQIYKLIIIVRDQLQRPERNQHK